MPSYTKLAALAQRLIADAGRSITIIQLDKTAADPSKPWRPADPRTTPTASLAVDAVFVRPSGAARLGMSTDVLDWVKRSQQIAIIASTADLQQYNELVDEDSTRWRIEGMEQLKPGDTTLLYYIGVAR